MSLPLGKSPEWHPIAGRLTKYIIFIGLGLMGVVFAYTFAHNYDSEFAYLSFVYPMIIGQFLLAPVNMFLVKWLVNSGATIEKAMLAVFMGGSIFLGFPIYYVWLNRKGTQ